MFYCHFLQLPGYMGIPLTKNTKTPRGQVVLKNAMASGAATRPGFGGSLAPRASLGRFAPVTPFPIMKLLRRAGILHHQQDPPPSAFWSHYCWECWAKINLICFSLLVLLLLLNFYLVVVLCWDPFSQACAWMDATAVLSESIGLKAEASAKRNYCCCNNMKSKQ